jgi:hypothetical protein
MNESTDSTPKSALTTKKMLAFARELRRLAAQVERDLARNEHISALSALTAIKPLTGTLADATLSEVMAEQPTEAVSVTSGASDNPYGYL